MKMRGSALLIAIFLLAAVGGISFSIGRLLYLDSNLAGIYENSTIAYYAAESGIEEGMLRYRYEKNSELPLLAGEFNPQKISLNNLNLAINPASAQSNVNTSFTPPDRAKHYYGLQMSFLGPYYGLDAASGGSINLEDLKNFAYRSQDTYYIPKDEAIKIDITEIGGNGGDKDLDLFWRVDRSSCEPSVGTASYDSSKHFVEAKVTGKTASGIQERKVALLTVKTSDREEDLDPDFIDTSIDRDAMVFYKLLNRIKSSKLLDGGFMHFAATSKVELSLKGIGCGFHIGLNPVGGGEIAQPYTTIKSTGYFGGQTRTLEAKIDRQAGTLYDLFDYVIYDRD